MVISYAGFLWCWVLYWVGLIMSNPDFVNDQGTKWWLQKIATDYGKRLGLKDISCWRAKALDGLEEFIVIKDGEPIYHTTTLEALGVFLDILERLSQDD